MRIAVCGLGSLWTWRTSSPDNSRLRTIYYNSTAIETPKGLKARALLYGVVRIEPAAGLNPQFPWRLVGRIFEGTGIRESEIRRQLTLRFKADGLPDAYLIVLRSGEVGVIDRSAAWKSKNVEIVSFSESGSQQEALLLMSPYSWVRTSRGALLVERPATPDQIRNRALQEMPA